MVVWKYPAIPKILLIYLVENSSELMSILKPVGPKELQIA